MTITIKLNTGSAAFDSDKTPELARIMADIAKRFTQYHIASSGQYDGPIRDSNGNTVGSLKVTGR